MKINEIINEAFKKESIVEDDYDDAVAAFLSKNEPVQGKTHPPRSAERLGGSRHIAGRGEAGRGKVGRLGKSAKSEPVGKPVVTAEATGESDPLANRADYAKRHGTGQVYKKTHAGDKTGMTQAYAYDIKRTGPKGVLPEENMSRAAKGHEKYGKDGMRALAKAGREGASEKELDAIRDKHDRYDESMTESVLIESQFDLIEEMVERLAEEHGVDPEVIWENFESVTDEELLDESAAWHRKEGKNKKGGLNAKGVASYRREHPGSKLQTAVTTKPSKLKPGSKAAKRRKSFCARMSGVKGPMKKPNGKPTRKALALRKWNC